MTNDNSGINGAVFNPPQPNPDWRGNLASLNLDMDKEDGKSEAIVIVPDAAEIETGLTVYPGSGPISVDDINLVPEACVPQEDYNLILQEYAFGALIKERSFYRIWRLRTSGDWTEIVSVHGEKYPSWEAFIRDISATLGFGRQIIFDRLRLYDQMLWLGYTEREMIAKSASAPMLYKRVLDRLVDWDYQNKTANAILIPDADSMDLDEAQEKLRSLIEDVEEFPRQIDAIKYIDENILHVPKVSYFMNEDSMIVEWTKSAIDTNGNLIIEDSGRCVFYPDSYIPDWVLQNISSEIKSK